MTEDKYNVSFDMDVWAASSTEAAIKVTKILQQLEAIHFWVNDYNEGEPEAITIIKEETK